MFASLRLQLLSRDDMAVLGRARKAGSPEPEDWSLVADVVLAGLHRHLRIAALGRFGVAAGVVFCAALLSAQLSFRLRVDREAEAITEMRNTVAGHALLPEFQSRVLSPLVFVAMRKMAPPAISDDHVWKLFRTAMALLAFGAIYWGIFRLTDSHARATMGCALLLYDRPMRQMVGALVALENWRWWILPFGPAPMFAGMAMPLAVAMARIPRPWTAEQIGLLWAVAACAAITAVFGIWIELRVWLPVYIWLIFLITLRPAGQSDAVWVGRLFSAA